MVLLSAVVALCGVVLCYSSAENGTAAHSVTIETVVAAAALPQGVGARHDGGHEAPHDAPTDAHASWESNQPPSSPAIRQSTTTTAQTKTKALRRQALFRLVAEAKETT